MPKLWTETIEAHRREVRDAILDTTAALAAAHGLRAVTMSQIAEETGIGRATLYKYFPDVDAILHAWHHRQITGHLQRLGQVRDQPGDPGRRLEAVLEAYARIVRETRRHHDTELAAFLHQDEHLTRGWYRRRYWAAPTLRGGRSARPTSPMSWTRSRHAAPASSRCPGTTAHPWTFEAFTGRFGERYRTLRAGEELRISARTAAAGPA